MKPYNDNLMKLVQLLSDGNFHEGSTIGEALGVTRSAIWKAVKKLQKYGVDIIAEKGQGYRLNNPMTLYDKSKIYNLLSMENHSDFKIEIFELLESTNNYLKNTTFETTKICLAEMQTGGKGRFTKVWHSPFGDNIYLSIGQFFPQDIQELSGLSLVIGLAILNTIEQYYPLSGLSLKWPNDILYNGKKLAGILIDANSEIHGSCNLIIGVGLNLNMSSKATNHPIENWTSIKMITKETADKSKITASLISAIFKHIQQFQMSGFNSFRKVWEKYDYLLGKNTTVTQGNKQITGTCCGITEQGHLKIQQQDGTIIEFLSGDASLSKQIIYL